MQKGESFYEDLKEVMKLFSVTYTNEASWQIGKNGAWLWTFISEAKNNKKAVLYKIDKTHSSDVIKSILGEEYDGVLASDRYSVYNHIKAKAKQKSIGHILREIKDITKLWKLDEKAKIFMKSVKHLLQKALEIKKVWKDKKIFFEEVTTKREEFQKRIRNTYTGEITE